MSLPDTMCGSTAVGVAAGGVSCEDPPRWRGEPGAGGMYLAYLRAPDGNKPYLLHRPPKA